MNSTHPAKADRDTTWAYYARGIGILLVVIGHVERGLVNSKIIKDDYIVEYIDEWIYSFHMPLFFLLSGIFVGSSLKRPFLSVVDNKSRSILYPYFLWSSIQTFIQLLLSSHINSSVKPSDLVNIFYKPVMQFWFLYSLLIMFFFFYTLSRLRLTAGRFMALSLLLYILPRFAYLGNWAVLLLTLNNLPYFAFGSLIGDRIHRYLEKINLRYFFSIICFCFFFSGLSVLFNLQKLAMLELLVGGSGILLVIVVSKMLARGNQLTFFRYIGTVSLQIYVSHTIASAGFRIVLHQLLHIDSPMIHICGGVLAGLAFPIALVSFSNRIGFKYAFIFPRNSQTNREKTAT